MKTNLEPIKGWRRWSVPVTRALLAALALVLGCSLSPKGDFRASSGAPRASSERTDASQQVESRNPEPVTADDLYAREALWPYRIELTEPWRPEGHVGRFGWGVGILVRVEQDGALRVDFASDGKHRVPLEVTNVLAEANRIRLGLSAKAGPNFVVALGTRLLDPSDGRLRAVARERLIEAERFLAVMVDPAEPGFEAIAEFAQAIAGRHGGLPILFPSGGHRDGRVANLVRKAGWSFPFVLDRYAMPLRRSLLDVADDRPWLMWLSAEGKALASVAWSPAGQAELLGFLTAEGADRDE